MKHLKGKSEETILEDFREKYKISSYEWEKMVKYIKRANNQFPFIFLEVNGFLERFVNIIQVTLMLGIGFFLAIFPWFKIVEVYNWGDWGE